MEWLINRRRMMYNKALPPVYITFEDAEVERLCAEFWGDYSERVITDNGNNTVNIVDSFVSMRNRSEVKRVVIDTQNNVDNTSGIYVEGTTKSPIGITKKQCQAVTTLGKGNYNDYARKSPFANNTVITTFPELKYFTNVKLLDRQCFAGCSNLEHIDITNITSATYQFGNKTKITSWIFEEGFTELGIYGFFNANPKIVYLDLPSTTTTIGEWNFGNNNNIVIVCRATTPPTFGRNNGAGKALYVPQDSIDDYKAVSNLSYFVNNNKIYPIEGSYYETHRELDPNEA